ncbi:MAG: aminopeptidase P family N-terminal domain-containing protein, partial [Bacteroides sp.]
MMNQEVKLHQDKIRALMSSSQIDAALISCNVNLLYAYGQIVSGYLYLPIVGEPMLFAKRPNNLSGENIFYIRRPEQIIELLTEQGIELPKKLMLEADELSFNEYTRLSNAFQCSTCVNGTPLIRQARS